LRVERRCDDDEQEREEEGDDAEHGHHPRDEVATRTAVERDGGGSVPGQDQQPEEQRPLLSAPEGGERVAERQVERRVVGDVREREVVAPERDEQHGRRHCGRAERREERVGRRRGETATAA
jgi:hypothetical protein